MKEYEKALYQKFEDNPFVYHYTSIEALLSILEGYRRSDFNALPFRAHSVYNTNDPREMKLGFDTVKNLLPEFEKSYNKSMNLSEVYENLEYENKCKSQCFKKPEDGLIDVGSVPYAISFACKRDFLPMWSMYGANKRGVCLKFNLGRLVGSLIEKGGQPCFVYYAGEKDNIIRDYLLPILYDFDAEKNKRKLTIEEKIEILSCLCDCISPFVKCCDWSYENEFRLVYHEHYGPKLNDDFLKGNQLILNKKKVKDYIISPISANALDEITIGPIVDYEVFEHVICNELKDCFLNNVKIRPSSIQITK